MKRLQGKVALVTGAAKRIGRSIAVALAEEGADVVITYRESADEAQRTVQELEALGVCAAAVGADLRQPESIRSAVAVAAAKFGRLDVLVNNAGRFETAALEEISVEQWDAMFETNTRGPFLAALPVDTL